MIEEDTAALAGENPFVKIKVESVSGTTATDLNIIGEASSVEGGPAGGASIDGSYERVHTSGTGLGWELGARARLESCVSSD